MLSKPLAAITKADLDALLAGQVCESKMIEYKRELSGSGHGGPVKILRSISSFANTNGGHVLYGVEAKDGIPVALPGLDSANEDVIRQRIENLCRDGVQPRITQVELKLVDVVPQRSVLVVHVPKSWAAPHRVTAGGHSQFYGRNSTSSYPLDVDELRTAFNLSASVAERARTFRLDRVAAIEAGEAPVPMSGAAKLVLHVASLSAFASAGRIGPMPDAQQRLKFSTIGWRGGFGNPNLDGYIFYSSHTGSSVAYSQYFRPGIVEAVIAFEPHKDGALQIPGAWIETMVVDGAHRYMSTLGEMGAGSPFFIFLSLLKVRGYRMGVDYMLMRGGGPADKRRSHLAARVGPRSFG